MSKLFYRARISNFKTNEHFLCGAENKFVLLKKISDYDKEQENNGFFAAVFSSVFKDTFPLKQDEAGHIHFSIDDNHFYLYQFLE